jgi:hypothetical protein
VLGVAAGFGGARLALASVRFTVASVVRGIPASDIRFDPQLAVLGVLVALATSLAAAVLPLLEVTAIPPLQGLRPVAPRRLPLKTRLGTCRWRQWWRLCW